VVKDNVYCLLQAWGSVSMLNESQITQLGCICQGFSAEELGNISIASLDTLEVLTACSFTQTQVIQTSTHSVTKQHLEFIYKRW